VVDDRKLGMDQTLSAAGKVGAALVERSDTRLVLRVADARSSDFSAELARIGELRGQTAETVDLSARAADLESSIAAGEGTREKLVALLARAHAVGESLLVEARLAEVDQALSKRRAELRALEKSAESVRIEILLTERRGAEPLPGVELPFDWLRELSFPELMNPSGPASESEPETYERLRSNAEVSLNLDGRLLRDRPSPDEHGRALALSFHARGANTDPVGFAAGLDAAAGGFDGFVYEARALAGVSTSIGSVLTLGLLGGVGVSGWTGDRVPSSLELPVETFVLVDFGEVTRLSLFSQLRFTPTREARRSGSEAAPFGDELALGAAVLVPWLLDQDRVEDGAVRLAFEYGELLETRTYTLSVGVGAGIPSEY
jgi:hypothetical protein